MEACKKIVQLRKNIQEFDDAIKASDNLAATSWDLVVSK
jgi:hypothetical protein